MQRLRLVREILLRPLWGFAGFIFVAAGNIPLAIGFLEFMLGKDLSGVETSIMASPAMNWLSLYWFAFFLIFASLGIAEGIYRKTSRFLGDRIKLKRISFDPLEEHPPKGDLYAALNIMNGENVDLCQCEARLEHMEIFSSGEWLPFTKEINPNGSLLTWPDFNERDDVVIISKKSVRLNVAKTDGVNNAAFIFRIGDERAPMFHNKFYIEVSINAIIGDRRIQEVVFTGFLLYDSVFMPGSTVKIKGEIGHLDGTTEVTEKEEIIAPSVSYKLYIKPGKLIDGEMVYEEQEKTTEKS